MSSPQISGAALPDLALDALTRDDPGSAYFFADRWLRLAGASANNLLLRAEAAHRLGLLTSAVADVQSGLALDPLHRLLNRRCVEWSKGSERIDCARTLVALSRRDAQAGLAALARAGEIGAGAVRVEDNHAIGWLAWKAGCTARLVIAGQTPSRELEPDPAHPYAGLLGSAVEFRLPCPAEPSTQISLLVNGHCVAKARVPGERLWPDTDPIGGPQTTLTVLAPVYGDYEATRECLISVAVEVETTPNTQALVIDDASPDPRIRGLLACFADWENCHVLRNPDNVGFVAAVNRGLKRLPYGDVLLLNADARLPWGALARFAETARSQPRIGIINPLSNHGEFVSYPRPFHQNSFSESQWRRVDRQAERCGKGEVIDIPSTTGFCSYVTRACLNAVGGLSYAFAEGYLEDADFGLRAREAGFRNVCDLSIYVPHIGSTSFKSAKKALVARNRVALARRFSDHEAECSAFLAADPLAPARARLETALAADSPRRRLLVGPARWRDALRLRAQALAEEGVGAIIAFFEAGRMTLRGREGAAPQNVEIAVDTNPTTIEKAIRPWPCDRIEYFWSPDAPAAVVRALEMAAAPIDLVLAAPPRKIRDCNFPRHERVFVTDAVVERACETLGLSVERWPRRLRQMESGSGRMDLAIFHPFETPASRRFLEAVARGLGARERTALLIGAASRDELLLAEGLLATGPASLEDWPRLLQVHAPRRLALPYRDQGFWLLDEARKDVRAPVAFFDAGRTGALFDETDLALDPQAEDAAAAAALLDWAFRELAEGQPRYERAAA